MATPFRAITLAAAALLAAPAALRAESGTWSVTVGGAQPSAGAKTWVGSTTGVSLDVLETYPLTATDAVRMRFGFYTFKAGNTLDRTITVPGGTATAFPANTTNELFAFTYGAEYVYNLPLNLTVLGGLGVAYVTATSKGTFDLTGAGNGPVSTNYSANNFVPYLCAGLGYRASRAVMVELRWQGCSMKQQNRPIDLSGGGYTTSGRVAFDKMNVSSISLGLNLTF